MRRQTQDRTRMRRRLESISLRPSPTPTRPIRQVSSERTAHAVRTTDLTDADIREMVQVVRDIVMMMDMLVQDHIIIMTTVPAPREGKCIKSNS